MGIFDYFIDKFVEKLCKSMPEAEQTLSTADTAEEDILTIGDKAVDEEMLNTLINFDNLNDGVDEPHRGKEFERFLEKLFVHGGYEIVMKPTEVNTSDGGIDLIVKKGNSRIAIQAKNWKLGGTHRVGVQDVRAFQGEIDKRKDIDFGYFITTSLFENDARNFVAEDINTGSTKRIELIGSDKFFTLVNQLYPELMAAFVSKKNFDRAGVQTCPRCSGKLVFRYNKKAKTLFMGCLNFPDCKYSKSILKESGRTSNSEKSETRKCAKCGADMEKRKNKSTGEYFWGCSRFPDCKYSESALRKNVHVSSNEKPEKRKCAKCGADMKKRKNKSTGEYFWGCSNFPDCKYSESA